MNWQGVKKLLKIRSYVFYWFATAFSMAASNILQFVLALYVLEKTGSSTIYASMLSIIIIPRILLTPIAGVMGDRKKKIWMIIELNAMTTFMMLSFSFYIHSTGGLSIMAIYLLVILLEVIEVFYQAPEAALLPEIIPEDLIDEGTALAKLDDGIMLVLSPVIGALCYSVFGLAISFWLITFFIGVSTLLNLGIKTPFAVLNESNENEKTAFLRFWKDFKDGMTLVKNDPFLRGFVIVSPLMSFSFGAVFPVTITHLFLEQYQISAQLFSIYRAITGSTLFFVPVLIIPMLKKYKPEKLIEFSSVAIAILLALIALTVYVALPRGKEIQVYSVFVIAFLDCLTIAAVIPVRISISIFYQKKVKPEFRSRVMSVSRMFGLSALPLGNLFCGMLTDFLPAFICILITAFGVGICYPLIRYFLKVYPDSEPKAV